MRYEYKKVKIAMPHCPKCKEMLSGDGSGYAPYQCSCGVWESNWSNPGEYEVKKIKPDQKTHSIPMIELNKIIANYE